jgi:hypothetical protein
MRIPEKVRCKAEKPKQDHRQGQRYPVNPECQDNRNTNHGKDKECQQNGYAAFPVYHLR